MLRMYGCPESPMSLDECSWRSGSGNGECPAFYVCNLHPQSATCDASTDPYCVKDYAAIDYIASITAIALAALVVLVAFCVIHNYGCGLVAYRLAKSSAACCSNVSYLSTQPVLSCVVCFVGFACTAVGYFAPYIAVDYVSVVDGTEGVSWYDFAGYWQYTGDAEVRVSWSELRSEVRGYDASVLPRVLEVSMLSLAAFVCAFLSSLSMVGLIWHLAVGKETPLASVSAFMNLSAVACSLSGWIIMSKLFVDSNGDFPAPELDGGGSLRFPGHWTLSSGFSFQVPAFLFLIPPMVYAASKVGEASIGRSAAHRSESGTLHAQKSESETFHRTDSLRSKKWLGLVKMMFHGTTLEAALSIQENGFDVGKSGSNSGSFLGNGVYVSDNHDKARVYATWKGGIIDGQENPARGAVLILEVEMGRTYVVKNKKDPQKDRWHADYDSAYASGDIMRYGYDEYCIKDPNSITIKSVAPQNFDAARALGYIVHEHKLLKKSDPFVLQVDGSDAGECGEGQCAIAKQVDVV